MKSLRNHSDLDLVCLLWGRPAGSKSSQLCHRCSPHPRRPAFRAWRVHKCHRHLPSPALHLTSWGGGGGQSAGGGDSARSGAAQPHSAFPQDQPVSHTHCGHHLPAGSAGRTARVDPTGDPAGHPPWLPRCCQSSFFKVT